MAWFKALRKRWATRDYARKLPKLLARDYGFAQAYSPPQIRRTIERYGLNTEYSCYAITMFSDRAGFDAYHQSLGENCDYDAMRAEVAAAHFHGNAQFTFSDIVETFPDSGAGASSGDGDVGFGGHAHGPADAGHGH